MATPTRRPRLALALLLAPALALGACARVATYEYELDVPEGVRLLGVDIENTRGKVELRADRGGERARIVARVSGDDQASPEQRAETAEITPVDAIVEAEGPMGVLRVRSGVVEDRLASRVDLYITVPRCDGLRVVTSGGDVEAVGTSGATHIETRQGAIELRTDALMTEDITLLAVDGNIFYQAPIGSTGLLDLETLDGESVLRDFSGKSEGTTFTRKSLTSTLGRGATNRVVAKTTRGNVRMWVMEDPVALTRLDKSYQADFRELIFTQGSRTFTRNLPEDETEPRGSQSDRGE